MPTIRLHVLKVISDILDYCMKLRRSFDMCFYFNWLYSKM